MRDEEKHVYSTGAMRSHRMIRYDLIPKCAIDRLAKRFTGEINEDGGIPTGGAYKYGESNWERGLPTSDVINHVMNHLTNWVEEFRSQMAYNINKISKDKEEIMSNVRMVMKSQSREDDDLAAAMWGLCVLMYQEETGMFHDDQFPLEAVKNEVKQDTSYQDMIDYRRDNENKIGCCDYCAGKLALKDAAYVVYNDLRFCSSEHFREYMMKAIVNKPSAPKHPE